MKLTLYVSLLNYIIFFQIFNSRDDLIKWARAVGKINGLVIIIKKSDKGGDGKKISTFVKM